MTLFTAQVRDRPQKTIWRTQLLYYLKMLLFCITFNLYLTAGEDVSPGEK